MSERFWDGRWAEDQARLQAQGELPKSDEWLGAYLARFQAAGVRQLLEVGCGSGVDTRVLVQAGFAVLSTDYAPSALALAAAVAGEGAQFLRHDSRERFPLADRSFDAVVASLSLHYFDFATTRRIVGDLARLLKPEGLLLFRLNSTSDPRATAPTPEQERYYYDEATCHALFADWEQLSLAERTVTYMGWPKVLWEGLVRKRSSTVVGQ